MKIKLILSRITSRFKWRHSLIYSFAFAFVISVRWNDVREKAFPLLDFSLVKPNSADYEITYLVLSAFNQYVIFLIVSVILNLFLTLFGKKVSNPVIFFVSAVSYTVFFLVRTQYLP